MTFVSAIAFDDAVAVPFGAAFARHPGFVIGEETPADVEAREALLDAAFGPARFLKTCERLRAGRLPARGLALSAHEGERLIATLRLWPVRAGAGRPALLLGPLAVAQDRQSLGLGAAMIRSALSRAKARNHRAILLVGDEPYYARFGFERRLAEGLTMPGWVDPARFLGLELAPGALKDAHGRVSAAAPAAPECALPRAA
ncbi:GNAT family N-acetyltransferase [Methylocystis heyeri]|uniref:GNAT family N-acetyltransferase n=1 Tax=Methylocystis heyeri TaxID=391905 RepID=A0A6B8KHI0_9HYPH|nr:N-acetyltransferase [Methylocystis heyeri]QGM45963.1 GNAT family N-acetyltransferase [Methylocystis heyeri]